MPVKKQKHSWDKLNQEERDVIKSWLDKIAVIKSDIYTLPSLPEWGEMLQEHHTEGIVNKLESLHSEITDFLYGDVPF